MGGRRRKKLTKRKNERIFSFINSPENEGKNALVESKKTLEGPEHRSPPRSPNKDCIGPGQQYRKCRKRRLGSQGKDSRRLNPIRIRAPPPPQTTRREGKGERSH